MASELPKNSLKMRQDLLEERLKELVSGLSEDPHGKLFEAAHYALFPGGKRLRPLFVLAAASDLGGDWEHAIVPACALELIHTYSLIHDDLPCMDDDAYRRGKPSLHVAFGEGSAVLTGDFLLTKAFEMLSTAEGLADKQRLELIYTLALRSGSEGMIGGQIVDIGASCKTNRAWIDGKKTGALFACALEFGGIIARASAKDRAILKDAGEHFGLAFQQWDDLMDGEGNKMEDHFQVALQALQALPLKTNYLKQLIEEFVLAYV